MSPRPVDLNLWVKERGRGPGYIEMRIERAMFDLRALIASSASHDSVSARGSRTVVPDYSSLICDEMHHERRRQNIYTLQ